MTDIPQVSLSWLGIALAAGPLVQWVGTWLLDLRRDRRADTATVGSQMEAMLRLQQTELARVNRTLEAYEAQLETLKLTRWRTLDGIAELRDGLIAARAMVHERERQLGQPDTVFPPVPEIGVGWALATQTPPSRASPA